MKPSLDICSHCARRYATPKMPTERMYLFCQRELGVQQSAKKMAEIQPDGKEILMPDFEIPENCAYKLEHVLCVGNPDGTTESPKS